MSGTLIFDSDKALVSNLAADYCGIVAAEAEAVVHCDVDLHLARPIWRVIQVARRVGSIKVDCGWDHVVIATQQGQNHFNAAAGAKCMTQMSFGA